MSLINQKEWEERNKLNKLLPFVTTKSHDIHHLARNIILLKALFSIWFSSNKAETEGITFQLSIYFTLHFNPINVFQDWNVNNERILKNWCHVEKTKLGELMKWVYSTIWSLLLFLMFSQIILLKSWISQIMKIQQFGGGANGCKLF